MSTMNQNLPASIGTRPVPNCCMCGGTGIPLYQNLRDHWFGAAGEWHLQRCPNRHCRLLWLDPMSTEDEIGKAYLSYYTHNEQLRPNEPSPQTGTQASLTWFSRLLQRAG